MSHSIAVKWIIFWNAPTPSKCVRSSVWGRVANWSSRNGHVVSGLSGTSTKSVDKSGIGPDQSIP